MVAIKRLKEGSAQGDREFEAEIESLGSIRHRNLVVLVAAYLAAPPSKERLLLYDFMPGGGLDDILEDEMEADSPFRLWSTRLSVLQDVARGLQYLHHDCQPRIIHRYATTGVNSIVCHQTPVVMKCLPAPHHAQVGHAVFMVQFCCSTAAGPE